MDVSELQKENDRLQRLAREYTTRFMPAYRRIKLVAQDILYTHRDRYGKLPEELESALRQILNA